MNKKYIYLLSLVILIVSFFVWKSLNNKPTKELPISVISTTPKNSAVFVGEKSEVTIILNRSISNKEGEDLKVEISPTIKTNVVYIGNKVRISPEDEFLLGTKYEFKVIFKGSQIYTLYFETNPFSKEQIKNDGGKQAEGDLVFNESYGQFLKDNPWYKDIPITKADYTIVYDFEMAKFRIIMNKKLEGESDRTQAIKSSINDLLKIGVKSPDNKYYLQEIE